MTDQGDTLDRRMLKGIELGGVPNWSPIQDGRILEMGRGSGGALDGRTSRAEGEPLAGCNGPRKVICVVSENTNFKRRSVYT